jgi:hypothetical protein
VERWRLRKFGYFRLSRDCLQLNRVHRKDTPPGVSRHQHANAERLAALEDVAQKLTRSVIANT